MSGRNRRPPVGEAAAGQVAWTALAGCVVATLLVSLVGVITFVRTLDIGPRVGDILVFRTGAALHTDWEVVAERPSGPTGMLPASGNCVLRPDVMAVEGGSLVVEERTIAPLRYRVHWAGPRTAIGSSNCGVAGDLMVSRVDLQMLTNAVGGAGVEHRTFAGF